MFRKVQYDDIADVALAYSGWEMECLRLDTQPTRSTCSMLELGGVKLRLAYDSVGSINEYQTPKDTHVFTFPDFGVAPLNWCGHAVLGADLLVGDPEQIGLIRLPPDYCGVEVEVSKNLSDAYQLFGKGWVGIGAHSRQRIIWGGKRCSFFRTWLFELMKSQAILSLAEVQTGVASAIREAVLEGLRELLGEREEDASLTPLHHKANRNYAVFDALRQYCAENPSEALILEEASSVTGYSLSQLRNACKSVSGLPPRAYFQRFRLHKVRQELKRYGPRDSSVSEIALGHGFTEFGRFSGYYRRMFSELPSETLRGKSLWSMRN